MACRRIQVKLGGLMSCLLQEREAAACTAGGVPTVLSIYIVGWKAAVPHDGVTDGAVMVQSKCAREFGSHGVLVR